MDSHVLLTAAREVVSAAGFDDDLEATMDRVSDVSAVAVSDVANASNVDRMAGKNTQTGTDKVCLVESSIYLFGCFLYISTYSLTLHTAHSTTINHDIFIRYPTFFYTRPTTLEALKEVTCQLLRVAHSSSSERVILVTPDTEAVGGAQEGVPGGIQPVIALFVGLLCCDLSRPVLLLGREDRIVFRADEHARLGESLKVLIFNERRMSNEDSVGHTALLTE